MNTSREFKYIKGLCCSGCPADICFYTDVDYWSVNDFLWEFDYLVNYVGPSKIRIHINSVGGSVIDGMSVFAKIQDCTIPTECINDALAASMGSIIWAAGDELYMKDYALIMIHNPFCEVKGDKQYNQATEAFTQQLKTIYMKRFGLSEEEAVQIMNGKEGEDGTFLTAQQAIEKGFIKEDHVIQTSKAVKDSIHAALKGATDISQIKAIYNLAVSPTPIVTINKSIQNTATMEENKISVFAALFGLTGDKANEENLTAKINEVKATADLYAATKKELETSKNELSKMQAELTGAQTSIKNLTSDLEKAKASLKEYQDAEAKAKEMKVNALIDEAVAQCKISKEERDAYAKMAQNDFALAESVLAKIPARANIGQEIAQAHATEAKDGIHTEEQKIMAMVDEVVGKDFKFRTLGK